MNEQDQKIAQAIWPESLERKREAALHWLGDHYALAKPINQKKDKR